ncbi:MAG: response regulator [Cyanobacteria bacterium J06555_12]
MSADSPMREQSYQYFRQEAPELLQEMEDTLFAMQDSFSVQQMHALMRIAHTLKGASASLELATIETVAHTLEDAFKALCHSGWDMSPPMLELLFQGYECLRHPLEAEFAGTPLDDRECIARAQELVHQLEILAGDAFLPDAEILTSAELGFDMTKSMFEVGVTQRLQQLESDIASQPAAELAQSLKTHCSVFLGLAESLGLSGFGRIASEAAAALTRHPDRVVDIAKLALVDFQQGRAAVLAGDRAMGGELSEEWQMLGDPAVSANVPTTPADSESNAAWLWEDDSTDLPNGEVAELGGDLLEESALDELWTDDPAAVSASAELELDLTVDVTTGDLSTSDLNTGDAADPLDSKPQGQIEEPETVEATPSDPTVLAEESAPSVDSGSLNVQPESTTPESAEDTSTEETESFSLLGGLTSMLSKVGESFSPPTETPETVDSVASPKSPIAPVQNLPPTQNSEPAQSAAHNPATSTAVSSTSPSTPSRFALPNELPTQSARATSVRVQVDQLDRLNYLLSELLSLHNRQALENEQLREAVRVLVGRLTRHQQRLRQLQDWERPLESPYPQTAAPLEIPKLESSTLESSNLESSDLESINTEPPPSEFAQSDFDALELERFSQAREFILDTVDDAIYLGEATDEIDLFAQASAQSLEKQRGLLTNSRDVLMDARMVPMGTILNRLPRILKQLENRYNKPVTLTTSGEQVLVEKAIVEQLYDPLLHLIRNAFDHGIESAATRRDTGKPPQGQIDIRCARRGSQLMVGIRDDGGGIDPERIRQRALEFSGLPASMVEAYSDRQLLDLLFQPGFSTAKEVSDISGRGVGLDVVRARLTDLQGQVTVSSTIGSGTSFTLSIPLNQTLETLLLCQVGYKTYAFLADGIEQILVPSPDRLEQQHNGQAMLWGEGDDTCYIPIHPLARVLPYRSPVPDPDTSPPGSFSVGGFSAPNSAQTVLLVKSGEIRLGIAVDRAIAEQELVVRPLGSAIVPPNYVCGGAVLADGRLALVVDGERLVTEIERERTGTQQLETQAGARFSPMEEVGWGSAIVNSDAVNSDAANWEDGQGWTARATILAIDDSLTQRMTVATTLEKAGYAVSQARNGRDGLQRLEETAIDLILCDLEMPMMNGYEFLSQIKKTPAWANIPVVMLTSRSSEKHRLAARELGAVGFLTKPCVDPILLRTVAELLQ